MRVLGVHGTQDGEAGGRARGEPLAWLSLLTLAKSQPLLFANSEHIREALLSLLRRDRPDTFKSKVSRP